MKATFLLAFLALAAPARASTLDPLSAAQQKTADPLDDLRKEWDAATREAAQTGGDSNKLETSRAELVKRAHDLMQGEPRGLLAVRTRVWLVTSGIDKGRQDEHLGELLENDISSPGIAELADWLRPNGRPDARATLETLFADSKDRTVRGRALWMLGEHAKHEAARTTALRKGDVSLDAFTREFGEKRATELRDAGSEKLDKEYIATLERVVKDFSDLQDTRGRTLGARADGVLFEMRNLQIGMLAPDIEAEDVDGAKFKLSDYCGKVVVVDFWGHW